MVQGGSGGCLNGRPKKVLWELSGQEVCWVESGMAAGGRWAWKYVWACSMPRCTEEPKETAHAKVWRQELAMHFQEAELDGR